MKFSTGKFVPDDITFQECGTNHIILREISHEKIQLFVIPHLNSHKNLMQQNFTLFILKIKFSIG